jgi:hypothetical protein
MVTFKPAMGKFGSSASYWMSRPVAVKIDDFLHDLTTSQEVPSFRARGKPGG